MRTIKIRVDGEEVCEPFELEAEGWTESDYFRLAPEDRPCEFVDGTVVMMSPVEDRHDDLTGFLLFLVRGFLRATRQGVVRGEPFTMRLRPGLNRQPDVFAVRTENSRKIQRKYLDGPADLAIEVVSPTSRRRDLEEKPIEYARHGVGEYWAIDLHRREFHRFLPTRGRKYRVEILRKGRVEAAAFPGLYVDVEWLWQDPLPEEFALLRAMLGS